MSKHPASRRRQAVEVLTTALAVVGGGWFLPHSPIWVLILVVAGQILLFGFVWWRLRNN
jgi:hypothetical protein